MTKSLAIALLLAAALPASAADPATPAVPTAIDFEGDSYAFVAREADAARIAEQYLRADETLARFSRRLTIADLPQAAGAKATVLGVVNIAKLGTPGLAAETFVDEDAPEHDVSVAWYALTDDDAAVEYHVARFVDLAKGGVREYHFTVRRYTNGGRPDAALAQLHSENEATTIDDVGELAKLDRAPQHPPAAPTHKKH